jgi:DNA-binding GntR family transcriptional regulator
MIRRVDDPRLYMRAAGIIAARIAAGEYESGQRLHLGLLSEDLGVGRRTLGHAMRVLRDRGLTEFFDGLGWYVV